LPTNEAETIMKQTKIENAIVDQLEREGWQGKMVSVEHIAELREEFEIHRKRGQLDETLYTEYLNRFDFSISDIFADARSMIIATAPQPQVRVTFEWRDRTHSCIIPPTYYKATDGRIQACLEGILKPEGYRLEKIGLPEKLLAVRSGLARYGKNNITYIPGMGSFHRPTVFITDMPLSQDNWGKSRLLKACQKCTACMQACPTGAIDSERFLVYAELCITFHNERAPAFPGWLDSSWHNCLVGCMLCQKACPMNEKFINWTADEAAFSEEETDFLLKSLPPNEMPESLVAKLDDLGIIRYTALLGRNLSVLL
jgi:epoxyqueuosine reductase